MKLEAIIIIIIIVTIIIIIIVILRPVRVKLATRAEAENISSGRAASARWRRQMLRLTMIITVIIFIQICTIFTRITATMAAAAASSAPRAVHGGPQHLRRH